MIVIGLLGAIALIVIAAINPIEQANRARDTRFKSDGGQLISAVDRYFAAKSEFPWVTNGTLVGVDSNADVLPFASASTVGYGVCATLPPSGCKAATLGDRGELITALELKEEFMQRDFIEKGQGTDELAKIMIGKPAGESATVYACFIPASNSTKQKACADGNVYTLDLGAGTRTAVLPDTCKGEEADYSTNGYYVCIPE